MPTGLLGLLSETVEVDPITGVEPTLRTAYRSFEEELKIEDIDAFGLLIPQQRGWAGFPALRRRRPRSFLYGIGYPLFSTPEQTADLLDQASPSEEINDWQIMRLSQIIDLDDKLLRPFAKPALIALEKAGLLSEATAGPLMVFAPHAASSDGRRAQLSIV
jgi:hypothetical protein